MASTSATQADRSSGPVPDRLQQLGSAFRASRAFLSAVELGVFSELAASPSRSNVWLRQSVCMPAERGTSSTPWLPWGY
jgi:hypothetical protein